MKTQIPHEFLSMLFANCNIYQDTAYITLSAIHPDRQHAVPSRHIRLDNKDALEIALAKLMESNQLGWGAFVAVGLRKQDLGRWRRGGIADVLALPALFVDVDAPAHEALSHLQQHAPEPSCILHSGGGIHAYWWLDEPTTDLHIAARVLGYLRQRYNGDALSVSQSMRLVGSLNTKPERNNALCHLHSFNEHRYPLSLFTAALQSEKQVIAQASERAVKPSKHFANPDFSRHINPRLIIAIAEVLQRRYGGFWRRSGWLAARCPCPHEHDLPGAHFSFKPELGLGICLGRHGKMLLNDLCSLLGLEPAAYGGLFMQVM